MLIIIFSYHHKPKIQINDKTYMFQYLTCNTCGNLIYLGKRIEINNLDRSDLEGRCGMSRKKLKDEWSGSIKELLDKITAEEEEQ